MSGNDQSTRLLVVEDEFMVAGYIEDVLADLGFTVCGPFTQVQPALDFLDSNAVDAAVLDVNLGGNERSYDIADRLAKKRTPFMFLTGYARSGIEPRFAKVPVLQKPFSAEELEKTVRQILS